MRVRLLLLLIIVILAILGFACREPAPTPAPAPAPAPTSAPVDTDQELLMQIVKAEMKVELAQHIYDEALIEYKDAERLYRMSFSDPVLKSQTTTLYNAYKTKAERLARAIEGLRRAQHELNTLLAQR